MMVPKDELILLLRDGLDSRDWATVSTSRESLKVRICHLRKEGHVIVSTPLGLKGRGAAKAVRYQLVEAHAE